MRGFGVRSILLWAVVLTSVSAIVVYGGEEKVQVLHKGKVITISRNAVPAHLAHGDEVVDDEPPPDPGSATAA